MLIDVKRQGKAIIHSEKEKKAFLQQWEISASIKPKKRETYVSFVVEIKNQKLFVIDLRSNLIIIFLDKMQMNFFK